MPIIHGHYESARALSARRRNIKKARRARELTRAYKMGVHHGGFALAPIIAGLSTADAFAKKYRPLTRLGELAKATGYDKKIEGFVDKLPGGQILKGIYNFGKSQLGYGRYHRRARAHRAYGARRYRRRVHRGGRRPRTYRKRVGARKHIVRSHHRYAMARVKVGGRTVHRRKRVLVHAHYARKPRRY